ncbi:MAG: cytochrome bc complex cytochrome b subunit, partial [Planctomycetes bacterium]|nr:cytochrome bc complex cytochrome b subunit [Planctomycetota bacterium]
RLHIPMLDEVKHKGLKTALNDKWVDLVTRVTAGLGPADVRGVLRDDPPGRPNPRLTPHAEGFWLHMKPTYYHRLMDGFYPTFRLGWLSTFFFAFEILTGIYLMIYYTPSPLVAYENMLNLLGNVPFGQLMRDLHRLAAELMVIVVVLHMLRAFVTGSYKKPRQFTWATGVVLLFVTLVLSFSGYLLPWDQLSLWAVTIGASMVEAIPPEIVGRNVNLLVRGAPEFGANGLLRFYLLHVVALPLVGILAFGVHYYKVIHHGHSLPPEAEKLGEDTAKRVPMDARAYFLPQIATRELWYVAGLLAVLFGAAAYLYNAPALEPHANPLITPLHTTAPWYFLWLQGMLKIGDKVIWGLIVPGVLTGLLLLLPYLEVGPSRRYGDRRIGLSLAALFVAAMAMLSYMGTPHYAVSTSPDQEAVAELLPQTHPGPLRSAPWDDLVFGSYEAAVWSAAPNATLQDLLQRYEEVLTNVQSLERTDVAGVMVIEDWQTDLKKVTLRVTWINVADGTAGEFSQSVYLHRDANYGQGA